MAIPRVETSPQIYARIGGALYLISIVVGILAELLVKDNGLEPSCTELCGRECAGRSSSENSDALH